MSTTSSSLSAGLQVLSNAGLLPSNLTPQQLQSASPAQLTQIAIASVQSAAVTSLFGGAASLSDSGNMSDNVLTLLGDSAISNGDMSEPALQALGTVIANASELGSVAGTAASSTASILDNTAADRDDRR
jgi:hypothetical protein